ncbi:hypothetical protein [Tessaracoccus caeni]|uniref:hypothetical protein n=1 Tax=Tessaracoccus caeni TaxID=3031239 RepID=UPI0023DB52CD|nr:hypothetical protein [Tessaracoccus caeni]MDF1489862.1 hypothetical protein [Tessaracoccus caeni]
MESNDRDAIAQLDVVQANLDFEGSDGAIGAPLTHHQILPSDLKHVDGASGLNNLLHVVARNEPALSRPLQPDAEAIAQVGLSIVVATASRRIEDDPHQDADCGVDVFTIATVDPEEVNWQTIAA